MGSKFSLFPRNPGCAQVSQHKATQTTPRDNMDAILRGISQSEIREKRSVPATEQVSLGTRQDQAVNRALCQVEGCLLCGVGAMRCTP